MAITEQIVFLITIQTYFINQTCLLVKMFVNELFIFNVGILIIYYRDPNLANCIASTKRVYVKNLVDAARLSNNVKHISLSRTTATVSSLFLLSAKIGHPGTFIRMKSLNWLKLLGCHISIIYLRSSSYMKVTKLPGL